MTWRGIEAGFHAGFEVLDVPAQCRGRRDAENVFEPLGTTEVENLGTAIMAVATQHYLRFRPVGADGAQQPVQEALDLLAARPFGGAEHGGDEATFVIEHDDRLEPVFIIVRIEEAQLLAAMNRVERVVDIQNDPLGDLVKGLAIRSTMARPIRNRQRASGRFSNREIVDCEHNSRSDGVRSSAILNMGSERRELASLPSS